ncbi:thiamine phosphate synthase [Helicobacter burdigaliensis]|uniref:thiamine phosphate synthase n=1 Tax=Helicobacter burdigaliensis TaxID=2315334 RepID=UPI000EF6799D|nr:thiamine phosphate synthase [Helicobacter burdigaliensis]
MLKGIYAISDDRLIPYSKIFASLEEAIKAGISIFQLRDKVSKDIEIKNLVLELEDFCKETGVQFILNDRIDLAIRLKVSGLHIGKKENEELYSKEELRKIRQEFLGILGISCYDSLETAKRAYEIGADYVAFGACFSSSTKPHAKKLDLEIFSKFEALPKCAIGGINAQNVSQIKNAQMIACIQGIWEGNITQNIKALKQNFV